MTLSCACSDWDCDYGTWGWFPPENKELTTFAEKRRRRCESCNELINIGSPCLEFPRVRAPYNEIEEKIKGTEIGFSPCYLCEKCGEIWLNLDAAGYCLDPWKSMQDAMAEYHEKINWKPGNGPGEKVNNEH